MKYIHNVDDVIKYIKKTKNNSQMKTKEIVLRVGLRTNGDIHIGNIIPLISSFIICEKLIDSGYKPKLIVVLVDLEYVYNEHIPFIYQDDKLGCHKNLAEHNIDIIKSFVMDLLKIKKIQVSFSRVSELLKEYNFKKLIDKYLYLDQNEFRILPVCKYCKSINPEYQLSNKMVSFSCGFCNQTQAYDTSSAEFAIDHDLLGAMEDCFFPIDIHIIGRDHSLADTKTNISPLERRELYLNYYNLNHASKRKEYITFLSPLILGKNNKKMSKSLKNGLFLTALKKNYGSLYYLKLYDLTKEIINNGSYTVNHDMLLNYFQGGIK